MIFAQGPFHISWLSQIQMQMSLLLEQLICQPLPFPLEAGKGLCLAG